MFLNLVVDNAFEELGGGQRKPCGMVVSVSPENKSECSDGWIDESGRTNVVAKGTRWIDLRYLLRELDLGLIAGTADTVMRAYVTGN